MLRDLRDLCQQPDGFSLLILFFPGWFLALLFPAERELLSWVLVLPGAASVGTGDQEAARRHTAGLLGT